jgi:carbamoyl-phosphate synthase small subunit
LDSAILALEDGTVFEGKSFGAPVERSGEVVFNTALTGYQEIFTDPTPARLSSSPTPRSATTGPTPRTMNPPILTLKD